MKIPFREYHLFEILESFEKSSAPLDAFLSQYFRAHRGIGSKDRKFIADTAYGMIRWRGLLDAFEKPSSWQIKHKYFQKFPSIPKDLPQHVRVSFPNWYFQEIEKYYGEETEAICLTLNECAPTTVRVNLIKTTRDALFEKWKNLYEISKTSESPLGIQFHKKINFFASDEFQEGAFEVQDEGSQLVSFMVEAKPGEKILDYCSGSGGKTLAFAPFMKGKGQIYVHDIRESILRSAKKRLKRAGVQNAQILKPLSRQKNALAGKMDAVLLDVPCSGSGTLRRNPDLKWRFQKEMLLSLIQEQRKIFEEAARFLKPGGRIIYATCSMFPVENEEQIHFFLENFPFTLIDQKKWLPESGGKDGFFTAVLKKR